MFDNSQTAGLHPGRVAQVGPGVRMGHVLDSDFHDVLIILIYIQNREAYVVE